MSLQDLFDSSLALFEQYDLEEHIREMNTLQNRTLTEHQFAQLVGKLRLYQFLPSAEKKQLPTVEFTDSHLNAIARAYYGDENFARNESGVIDLWRVYNLFTGANKSSYIDTFLDRSLGATQLLLGIAQALDTPNAYSWFIE